MNHLRAAFWLLMSVRTPWRLYRAKYWIEREIERTGGRKGKR